MLSGRWIDWQAAVLATLRTIANNPAAPVPGLRRLPGMGRTGRPGRPQFLPRHSRGPRRNGRDPPRHAQRRRQAPTRRPGLDDGVARRALPGDPRARRPPVRSGLEVVVDRGGPTLLGTVGAAVVADLAPARSLDLFGPGGERLARLDLTGSAGAIARACGCGSDLPAGLALPTPPPAGPSGLSGRAAAAQPAAAVALGAHPRQC